MIWLMVAAGGAVGSVARFGVAQGLARTSVNPVPYATAIVNVIGCAIAGLLLGLITSQRLTLTADQRALLFSGVLGGLTTFSGVGMDTLALTQDARVTTAIVNIGTQVIVGLAALFAGYALARM
jgi:CrcB protein